MFCQPDGSKTVSFKHSIDRALARHGIKVVTPHGLRKTFCSQLARHKVHPKVAQQLLGHSNIRLTMDIYTEVGDEQKIEAVKTLPTCRELAQKKFQVIEGAIS